MDDDFKHVMMITNLRYIVLYENVLVCYLSYALFTEQVDLNFFEISFGLKRLKL